MGQLTLTICDYDHGGERVEADHHEVSINGTTVQVDLCAEHGKPVLELLEQLRLVGQVEGQRRRRIPATVSTPGEFDCSQCQRSFPTAQGLAAHRGQAHYEGIRHSGQMDCPLCDKTFPSKGNVIQHLRGITTHGMTFEGAKAEVERALAGA